MTDKIAYRVIFASSNENGHEAQELEIRNSIERDSTTQKTKNKGKGWQSARFCEYPQDLVVSLDSPTEISQIQILSHQSKIASKVEIWVGLDPIHAHDASSFKSIEWKRLGYLSLDKNERSNWKARELKSVYIHTTANYIKFSLHESHINTINLFNQIGIMALTVLGDESTQTPMIQNQASSSSSQPALNITNENTQYNEQNHTMNAPAIDSITSNKIRELMILKTQAVQHEDYDEAKRCKVAIEHLQNSAKQLSKLEREKKIAVEKEDYDMAKALKLQIERLRSMSLNTDKPQAMNPMNPVHQQQIHPMQQAPSFSNNQSYNSYAPQPQNVAYAQPQNSYNPPIGNNTHSPHASLQFPPRQTSNDPQQRSHSHSMSISPHHRMQPLQEQALNSGERPIRPMKKVNYSAVDASTNNPFGDDCNINNNHDIQRQQSVDEAPFISQAPAANPPNNHDNNGDEAPPLKASVRKGAEKSILMFGEYTICLLNSKNWNHRDEGLKNIASFVNKKQEADCKQVFKLSAKWIYSALQDRVAGVVLSGIDTLNTLISVYDDNEIDDNDICKCLHSIASTLVNILGHSNTRLVDGSGSILIRLCHYNEELCRQIYNVLIKKMKKLLPKHLKGRGFILLQLMPEFNLPKGVDFYALMDNLIKPQLTDKNGDVRDIGIQITGLLHQMNAVRSRLVKYLENVDLNDFIKDTLNNHFEEICGTQNVLERQSKSIKEQSRPSKAMNRTSNAQNTQKRRGRNTTRRNNNTQQRKKQQKPRNKPQQNMKQTQEETHVEHERNDNMHQVHEHNEEDEEEVEDMCNFCGLRDVSFMENEENLDLHYWQSCPMLTSCKLCEQVIEIATLHEHILTECESGIKHELCQECNIPYAENEEREHECVDNNDGAAVCPLCLSSMPSVSDPWKQHLLTYPGCKANPRPLLQ